MDIGLPESWVHYPGTPYRYQADRWVGRAPNIDRRGPHTAGRGKQLQGLGRHLDYLTRCGINVQPSSLASTLTLLFAVPASKLGIKKELIGFFGEQDIDTTLRRRSSEPPGYDRANVVKPFFICKGAETLHDERRTHASRSHPHLIHDILTALSVTGQHAAYRYRPI